MHMRKPFTLSACDEPFRGMDADEIGPAISEWAVTWVGAEGLEPPTSAL